MKRIIICAFVAMLAFGFSNQAKAQDYNTAVGLRFGGTSGLTIKTRGFEGIVGFWGNGFSLTGLAEKHTMAFDSPDVNWYYGWGGHVAFYNDGDPRYDYGRGDRRYDDSEVGFGIDGIVGLEFSPREIPLAFSLGLKPFLEIDTDGDLHAAPDPAIGIKFIIN